VAVLWGRAFNNCVHRSLLVLAVELVRLEQGCTDAAIAMVVS
jgi:hypothetical protein